MNVAALFLCTYMLCDVFSDVKWQLYDVLYVYDKIALGQSHHFHHGSSTIEKRHTRDRIQLNHQASSIEVLPKNLVVHQHVKLIIRIVSLSRTTSKLLV